MMENRKFSMHPELLYSVIRKQAGTLEKALLEGVMNSIDAGATRCNIELTTTSFTIRDNGRGFASRDEIEKFFEVFGTPHAEGDAIYGKFRMGRGQIFAFGASTWRTGKFQMFVDINKLGLEYKLKTGLYEVKGCTITGELYTPLDQYALNGICHELGELLAFSQIPVKLNGKAISKRVQDVKWTLETPQAYIKASKTGELAVYNLGVKVRDYSAATYGISGIVVSKLPLEVNFARNDILTSRCQVWSRILPSLGCLAEERLSHKSALSEAERRYLSSRLASEGTLNWSLREKLGDISFIRTVTGKVETAQALASASYLCVAKDSATIRLAERFHKAHRAFCISDDTLYEFGVSSPEAFLRRLEATVPGFVAPKIRTLEQLLADGEGLGLNPADIGSLTVSERAAFEALSRAHARLFAPWVIKGLPSGSQARELLLGESSQAWAWTDGANTVHVERKFLTKCAGRGLSGWVTMANVLIHEYCHSTPDLHDVSHDQAFYELFEELATSERNPSGEFAALANRIYLALTDKQKATVPVKMGANSPGARSKIAKRPEPQVRSAPDMACKQMSLLLE